MSNLLSLMEFESHVESLVNMIKHFNPDEIIGIKWGGLILSKKLSDYLQLPHKEVRVSFYNGKEKRKKPIIEEMINLDPNKKYLFCDDLVDSGATLKFIKKYYSQFHIKTAVILQNEKCHFNADFFADYYDGGWVTFEWEKQLTSFLNMI